MNLIEIDGTVHPEAQNIDYLDLKVPLINFSTSWTKPPPFLEQIVLTEFGAEKKELYRRLFKLGIEETACEVYLFSIIKRKFWFLKLFPAQIKISLKNPVWFHVLFNDLLDDFYKEIQRAADKPKALYFFLRFIDILGYCRYLEEGRIARQLMRYLELVPDSLSNSRIVVEMIKVFSVRYKSTRFLFMSKKLNITFILNSAQREKFNILSGIDQAKILSGYNVNHENFMLLLRYGVQNTYSSMSCKELRARMYDLYWEENNREIPIVVENLIQTLEEKMKIPDFIRFRIYQVIHFYFVNQLQICSYKVDIPIPSPALKMLWNSITDPFLIENDFLSFVEMYNPVYNHLVNIYKWYDQHVCRDVTTRTPRSLQHLSRCAIRLRLTENFQLPKGVCDLTVQQSEVEPVALPNPLKLYLLLEQCEDYV